MRYLPVLVVLVALAPLGGASAQDLEPRAFSPAPVGMNFAIIGYGYSEGGVFFDHSLPAEDVTGTVHNATAGYLRTLNVFGVTGKLGAVVPFAWAEWEGLWQGERAKAVRRGFSDPVVSFAVNFVGAPARTMGEMATYKEKTVVGASLVAIVPIGQYDPDKLINLGSNRWAFRGRIGASQKVGYWTFELMAEVWGFTQNSDAIGGTTIDQDPILTFQFNAVYQFKRGFWLAVGYGYGEGGRTMVSGVEKDTRQVNKRFGTTLVVPVNQKNSLKLTYLHSYSTLIGADFDKLGLFWQVRWGGGL